MIVDSTFSRSDDNASVPVQGRQCGRGLLRRERRGVLGAAQVLGVGAATGGGGLQDLRRRHQGRPAPGEEKCPVAIRINNNKQ